MRTRRPAPAGARPRVLLALLVLSARAAAATTPVTVPVTLPYALLERALAEHVFATADGRLEVLRDGQACNRLVLARPRVAAQGDGRVRVTLDVEAHGGSPLGTRCLLPFTWHGTLDLVETPFLEAAPLRIGFRVTDSHLAAADRTAARAPTVLWDWVKRLVHPRLEAVVIDVEDLRDAATALLDASLAAWPATAGHARATFAVASPQGGPDGLDVVLGFDLLEPPASARRAPLDTPLSAVELAAWDAAWQDWDAFLTWAVKQLAYTTPALRDAVLETLEDARYTLRAVLARDARGPDPARELFHATWGRLAPLVAALDGGTGTALRYLAFVGAGDALAALDTAGAGFGVRIDRAGLRALARSLVPAVDDGELAYDERPDPALRELYGLPPEPDFAAAAPAPSWLDWWLRPARAAADAPAAWLPPDDDPGDYLARVDTLLGDVVTESAAGERVAERFRAVYRLLVPSTAWQESCWRQFVERAGEVQPIRSSAGSIGLMQINRHVWRGLYDVERLADDIAYNARAGNEILVHYLVDYAIRRKEHEVRGDLDDLARATYAVYNGGPAHLRRYREAATRAPLKAIDEAFWHKYQALRAEGAAAVRSCYGR
ncbi:MAG: lytic transglycosylase domain-containing protein [Gammaproteobacteria bacterium]|nr:lytic transglycosylase domain-containing protein [Gammaproteobacteria bacterium]